MGQSGVEPEDQKSATNSMWLNKPERFAGAKHSARNARVSGNHASAHSIMLSAYITALSGNPAEGRHPVKFFLLAMWHALCMSRRLKELNHNQLDVWLQFMLKLRAKLPIFGGILNKALTKWAEEGVVEASVNGKPHQCALARMTLAEIILATSRHNKSNLEDAEIQIEAALNLEEKIRKESDQPQGLRQFVRILRKTGELYGKLGDKDKQRQYLERAIALARDEASAPDQVDKIYILLAKL